MVEEVYFEPDELYLLYQIYPEPENPIIEETVEEHSEYFFSYTNSLYFIITEEKHKKLSEELPKWINLNKVSVIGIEELLKLCPSKKEILQKAGLWKPPTRTGGSRGWPKKKRRYRTRK